MDVLGTFESVLDKSDQNYIVWTKEKGKFETNDFNSFRDLTLHNTTGPAFMQNLKDGTRHIMYYDNGDLHREGGAAVIMINPQGSVTYNAWYRNGLKHREDGPAVNQNGLAKYYIKDIRYTKEQFLDEIVKRKIRMI